jgi:hypothetical protein
VDGDLLGLQREAERQSKSEEVLCAMPAIVSNTL